MSLLKASIMRLVCWVVVVKSMGGLFCVGGRSAAEVKEESLG